MGGSSRLDGRTPFRCGVDYSVCSVGLFGLVVPYKKLISVLFLYVCCKYSVSRVPRTAAQSPSLRFATDLTSLRNTGLGRLFNENYFKTYFEPTGGAL